MDGFNDVDMGMNPYFGSYENYNAEAAPTAGSGNGYGWMDWNSIPDGDFNNPNWTFNENSSDTPFELSRLQDYMKRTGNVLKERNPGGNSFERGMFTKDGQQVGDLNRGSYSSWVDDLAFTMGSMFLSPFGGIASGGAAGGVGGSISSNAGTAAAINGGLAGATSAYGTDGSDRDILKAGVTGGISGYMPDVAGYAGITDPNLRTAANGALKGGTLAAINNGNVGEGIAKGGLGGLASYAADAVTPYFQTLDDMPGTIGGNMADADGETSVTLGGMTTEAQANADQERKQVSSSNSVFSNPELGAFFDKLIPSSPQGWGDMAQGLMGMYGGYRQRRDAKKMMDRFGSNRGSYEKQLRQNLQRRDATTGRRSNFGGREVELQAKLAELDSRNMPAMAQLQGNQTSGLLNMLQSALRYGGKSGAFGDKYNPNAQQTMPTSAMLPSTWQEPPPVNMGLNYDPNLGRERFKLGGM